MTIQTVAPLIGAAIVIMVLVALLMPGKKSSRTDRWSRDEGHGSGGGTAEWHSASGGDGGGHDGGGGH